MHRPRICRGWRSRSPAPLLLGVPLAALSLFSCTPKIHESVLVEKVQASLRSGGTFSAGGCFGMCAPFSVQVLQLNKDGTGVVHVKGECAECDEEMRFLLEPADPPVGHRARGRNPDLDPERWSLRLTSTKPPKPTSPEEAAAGREHEERLRQAREMMNRERGTR